jgi:hypothetical protein
MVQLRGGRREMNTKEVRLTPRQKEKLLRNIWLLHDGRWFLKSTMLLGFNVATRLNLDVVESIGKTEIKQLVTEANFGEIKSIEDLKELIELASPLYFPPEHKYEIKIIDDNTLLGRVVECYVYQMVGKAGKT